MSRHYLFSGKNSPKVASAFAPKGTKLDHELTSDLGNASELPFELQLVKLTIGKEELNESTDLSDLDEIWLDYLPNSLAWPFFQNG